MTQDELRNILIPFANYLNKYKGFEDMRFDFMVIDYMDDIYKTEWIPVTQSLPILEGYYKVKFEDGTIDEKPFRIRPHKNIHGFMTLDKITHWAHLSQPEKID